MINLILNGTRIAVMDFDEAAPLLEGDTLFAELQNSARRREKQLTLLLLRKLAGSEVVLRHDPDGAPLPIGEGQHVSISHSGHEVAVALSDSPYIGIDVESPREALRRVSSRFLSRREQEYYTDLNQLLRAWVIKEAVYKAMHRKNLTSSEIALSCQEPENMIDHAEVGDVRFSISLHHLPTDSLLGVARAVNNNF
ncbi:MAG: 4'-phosphopantetheinyl transferase superfamily protein [Muribaculaceae bacterium]|nr:4'-phosphopantetheinyl transferase superfamily protein [Muribaculaceae bacterium]